MNEINTSTHQQYSLTTITGTIETIKFETENDRGHNIAFIIQRTGVGNKPSHQYIVSAFSKAGFHDQYGIHSLMGEKVEATCYVNGRIRETSKGQYHTIELNLHSIEKVN